MDERLKFVARLLDGENLAVMCREFDISRKTGYKIFSRYKDCGLEGLTDRSRRPYRHGMRLPFQIERSCAEQKCTACALMKLYRRRLRHHVPQGAEQGRPDPRARLCRSCARGVRVS
jgi:transposase